MSKAHIDFETRSKVDLRKAGVHRYAEDPSTGIWTLNWRIDDGPISTWHPSDFSDPVLLLDHIATRKTVVAHNAIFERTIWNIVLRRARPAWPMLSAQQQSCTLVRAAALALPLDLDRLAQVLSCANKKDMDGHRLMMQMSKPRKVYAADKVTDDLALRALDDPIGFTIMPDGEIIEWWGDEQRRWLLDRYCAQDVEVESEVDTLLKELDPAEHRLWLLDQDINDRGIPLDMPMVAEMLALKEIAKRKLDARMSTLTDGQVKKCSMVDALKAWFATRSIRLETIGKETHEEIFTHVDLLGDNLARQVLETRRAAGKLTSVAKYSAMERCVGVDGRARGQFQHHGATTGRPTGRLIQFTNLPRCDEETELPSVQMTLEIMQELKAPQHAYAMIEQLVGEPLLWMSKALRSTIKARDGHKLVGGDLSNIEGRKNAWFAGEHWKLQAFADYDAGRGHDLYKVTAAGSLGISPEQVTGLQRQSYGKVAELSLGYQGSVGAYISMAKNYNTKPEMVARIARENTAPDLWAKTAAKYAKATNKVGLSEDVWTGIKVVVDAWRSRHPAIEQGWYDLQDAAVSAVESGQIVPAYGGKAHYLAANGFLWCQLPCGRVIAYCRPELVSVAQMEIVATQVVTYDEASGEFDIQTVDEEVPYRERTAVRYWAIDGLTKQWRPWYLYGGLQCENIVQAAARDVQVSGMLDVEALGYPVILHVYDELVAEVKADFGSAAEFGAVMSRVPTFCQGLPLAAKAWEGVRYAK